MISIRSYLTAEEILSKTTEYEIYSRYFQPFKYKVKYCSPFRNDPVPSFSIRMNANGSLFHMDFGKTELCGNCFQFVMQLFGLTFPKALEKINNELCLTNNSVLISPKPKLIQRTDFKIIPREFTQEELAYWNHLSVSKSDLEREDVFSIDKLYINGYLKISNELRFAYLFKDETGEYLKIYTPYAQDKSNKFKTNVPSTLISGWDKVKNGGKTALITKSKKDELVSTKILPTSCSLQSENCRNLTTEKIKFFKENFDQTIILFDPDPTGIDAALYYESLGLKSIVLPYRMYLDGIKDLADLSYNYGIGSVVQFFKSNNII